MKTTIISLGGSIIIPDQIDTDFLKDFKKTITNLTKEGHKFVIYCGGGSLARKYQQAYKKVKDDDQEAMDWLGISATHHNALLLKAIFYEIAEDYIIYDPTQKISLKKPIIFAGGWKPGWSTDYDAVLVAKQLKINHIINMSNIDYVYDKDPKKDKSAKPIKHISWKKLREIVGSKWSAGLNAPFDPIAAKEAEKLNLKVHVIGKNLKNLKQLIKNKDFKGTTISD